MSSAVGSRRRAPPRGAAPPAHLAHEARASGMAAGLMLNSVTPRPSRSSSAPGSAAISPQTATPRPRGRAGADDVPDHAQDRRMQRFEQPRHPAVGPVDGQAGPNQVVRADAEEVRLVGQQVGRQRGRRHLDHHADGHRGTVPGAAAHVAHGRPQRGPRLAQLLDARDERQQHAQRAVARGPRQRAQLRAEQVARGSG